MAERALRVAISRGDMPPGYRLVEAELVSRTGVSRSAVRMAIDALAAEGLVERIPNKGARVRIIRQDVPEGLVVGEDAAEDAVEGVMEVVMEVVVVEANGKFNSL